MYVPQRTWLENGPRRRGVGELPAADSSAVTVTGCAPDICFNFGFPWVGRRWEIPADGVTSGRVLNDSCYCKPAFEVGGMGEYITYGVLGLLAFSLIRKVAG